MNKKEKIDKSFITPGQTTGLTDRQIKAMALRMLRAVKRHATKPDVVAPEPTPSDGIDLNAENILIFNGPRSKVGHQFTLSKNQEKPLYDPSWQQIVLAISEIGSTKSHSFVLFSGPQSDFEACYQVYFDRKRRAAGNNNRQSSRPDKLWDNCIIIIAGDGKYRFGIEKISPNYPKLDAEPMCKEWFGVAGVAPVKAKTFKHGKLKPRIAGLKDEILNQAQALTLVEAYWKRKPMPTTFLWRETTRAEFLKENDRILFGPELKDGFQCQLVENKKTPVNDPTWQQIARAISAIDGAAPHSYAILTRGNGLFIQTTACSGKYHVEVKKSNRRTKTESLWVAGVAPFQAKAIISGKPKHPIAGLKGEILNKTQTLSLFKAFWKRKPMPTRFVWRNIWPEIIKDSLKPESPG